jgi:hypothetical protein
MSDKEHQRAGRKVGTVYFSGTGGTREADHTESTLGWKVISGDPYIQVQVNYHRQAQKWFTPTESELWMIERGMENFPGGRIRELDFVLPGNCIRLQADNTRIVGNVYLFQNPQALALANPKVRQHAYRLTKNDPPEYVRVEWVGEIPFDLEREATGSWVAQTSPPEHLKQSVVGEVYTTENGMELQEKKVGIIGWKQLSIRPFERVKVQFYSLSADQKLWLTDKEFEGRLEEPMHNYLGIW